MNMQKKAGVFSLFAVLLAGVQAEIIYQDDFSGAAGAASATVPEIYPEGFGQESFKTGLDGSGRLESSDSSQSAAGYRIRLGDNALTADPALAEISYTVTMRTPTNDWVMIGFHENDLNGLLTTEANTGPVVQFNPGGTVLLRGGTYSGQTNGNVSVPLRNNYADSEVITAKMTYHVPEQTMDLTINGSVVTNGFALEHEFPVGVPSDPVVHWLQMQLRLQPSAANGGATIDSVQVETLSSGYLGWASEWDVDIGAETDDFDGDGLDNLYEYGLGGIPTNAADRGQKIEFGPVNVGGTNRFRFVHPQRADPRNGLEYFVELNTNLVSGLWTTRGYSLGGTGITGSELNLATNWVDMEDDRKFMRLLIAKTGSAAALRALILQNRPLPLTRLDIAARLDVADFGALPNDGQDDRAAVQAAVQAAKSMTGPVQIDFSPGVYDFFAVTPDFSMSIDNAAIALHSCENLIIDGHGAEVVIHRQDVSFA
jgi:hypothetical protein